MFEITPLLTLTVLQLFRLLILVTLFALGHSTHASPESQRIYRCGSVYTNQPESGGACKPLTGGNVTVIEGTRVQTTSAPAAKASAASQGKVDVSEQQQRDVQAQAVLAAELQRALRQHADLLREWNGGEPERRADEWRQPQKYQDRLAQLRSAMQRVEADIASLQRELGRLPANATTQGGQP